MVPPKSAPQPRDPGTDPLARRPGKPKRFGRLRASFLTGLVVIAPIALTIYLIWSVIGWIDGFVLPLVPAHFRPEQYIGVDIRGLGVVIFLIFTVLVGWVAKGIIGRSLIGWGERFVDRMPVVRSIYGGLKQIAETVFAQTESNFERACLVEYPRKGVWALAFVSTTAKGELALKLGDADTRMISVFLPTTPNPTSGFLLIVPERDVTYLDMTVEDAAKLVISAGLVYPPQKAGTVPPAPPAGPVPAGLPGEPDHAPAERRETA
ncbi:DUF502 domain-containing protein [Tropicimonas omnivorans]|uniref:DUF502 domain-containing protein n=1 Tax=Tropicimonas omnivorans TaxID=3075590 RepID=UPI003D784554